MKTYVISNQLQSAIDRKGITQTELARDISKAKTTVNGYFRGEPITIKVMQEIVGAIDDSVLSQQLSHETFDGIPAMESDVYRNDPYALDVIQNIEQEERNQQKARAMLALTKNKHSMSRQDKEAIFDYAMNYLDEVFIEIRYIISLFDKLGMSMMSAVKKRVPHWKMKKYLRGE